MNARILASRLTGGGFTVLRTGIAGVDTFIRKVHDKAYIVGILDFGKGEAAAPEQIASLESNLAVLYGTTDILFVAFSYDSYEARSLLPENVSYWIYNEKSSMLEIYDDNSGEFLNVRQMIEKPEVTVASHIFSCNNLIIVINVIVFIITEVKGNTLEALFLYQSGGITADSLFKKYEIYRLFTSIFLHSGISHIFNNMLVLFFVGDNLERAVGRLKYLAIYFASGIIGGVVSQLWELSQGNYYTVCVGASGAIFGVIGAMIWILIRNKGRLEDMKLWQLILFVVSSIYMSISSVGISLSAHLGGLFGGFLFALLLYRKDGLKI